MKFSRSASFNREGRKNAKELYSCKNLSFTAAYPPPVLDFEVGVTGLGIGLPGIGFVDGLLTAGLLTPGLILLGLTVGLTGSGLNTGTLAAGIFLLTDGAVGYFFTKLAEPSLIDSGREYVFRYSPVR